MTSQYVSLNGKTMRATSGARSVNPSGAPEFIPSVRVARSLIVVAMFGRSLFVLVPLAIVLSILCLFTAFDHFVFLKHFLRQTIMADVNVFLCFFISISVSVSVKISAM